MTVPDIDSDIGLMHTLFALEDIRGLTIGEIDGVDNDLITLPIGRIILYPGWIAGEKCFFAACGWQKPY